MTIKREGREIIFEHETSIGFSYTTKLVLNDEPYAILLKQNLSGKFEDTIRAIREQAYNTGWQDKQSKRPKRTWFSGQLKTNNPF